MKSIIFSMFIAMIISNSLYATTEETYLIRLPREAISCDQEAQILKERYQRLKPTVPIESRCIGDFVIRDKKKDFHFNSIEMRYSVSWEDRASLIVSHFYSHTLDGSRFSSRAHGMYSDLNSCLKELPQHIREFGIHTKTSPLAATCEPGKASDSISYAVRIDTVGKTEVDIYAEQDLPARMQVPAFKKSIEQMIADIKGVIVARKDGYTYYYAKAPIEPHFFNFGSMTLEECKSQIKDAELILAYDRLTSTAVGCTQNEYNPSGPVALEAVWNHFHMFNQQRIDDTFYRFSDCMNEKARLIEDAQRRGYRVKAGVCSLDIYRRTDDTQIYKLDLYPQH